VGINERGKQEAVNHKLFEERTLKGEDAVNPVGLPCSQVRNSV
jgi:hypothetical protein